MDYEINVGGDNAASDGEGGGYPNSESRSALTTPVNNLRLKVKDTPYDNAEFNSALAGIEAKGTKAELPAFIGVANAVVLSVDKFQSGDEMQAISGVLDIVSAGTLLIQPYGAIISPLFRLLSGVFMWHKKIAEEKGAEPLESVLKRVITKALGIQTSEDLRSTVEGEMNVMIQNLQSLKLWLEEDDEVLKNSGVYDSLKAGTFNTDGLFILGKLNFYIAKGWNNQHTASREGTEHIGVYFYCYSQIFLIRTELLFLLESLYGILGDAVMVRNTQNIQALHRQTSMDSHGRFNALASPLFGMENPAYDNINQLPTSERIYVETYLDLLGIHMEGYVCTINSGPRSPYQVVYGYRNTRDSQFEIIQNTDSPYQNNNPIGAVHLFVPPSDFDHERLQAYTDVSNELPDLKHQLFRKISLNSTRTMNGEKFETFKLYALNYGGYVKIGDDATTETYTIEKYSNGKIRYYKKPIKGYTSGNEFFVEVRKNTGENEHFEWFVDKQGRLTNTWANKVLFPLSLSKDESISKRSFVTLVTNFKNNDNVGYQGNIGYGDTYFTTGFHFNKTNSN